MCVTVIFQVSVSSLNPGWTIEQLDAEPCHPATHRLVDAARALVIGG
jgi:hypothetical protein